MGYVYRHIRTDTGVPFYIGIGIDCKGKHERAVSRHGRNKHWKNIVEKTKHEIEILFESDDYELIKSKEIEFISLYGRLDLKTGILCNITDGGDGNLNYICSDETREKLKILNKGEKNPMWGKKISEVGLMSKELHGKKVLNTLTEIVYASIAEAAKQEGFGLTYLKTRLSGKVKNNTFLILFKNEN